MLAGRDAAGRHDHRSQLRAIDGRPDVIRSRPGARQTRLGAGHYCAGVIRGMYDFFTLATTVKPGPATLATSYSMAGPRKIESDRSEKPKSSSSQWWSSVVACCSACWSDVALPIAITYSFVSTRGHSMSNSPAIVDARATLLCGHSFFFTTST